MAKKGTDLGKSGQKKYSEMTDAEKIAIRKDAFVRLIKPRVDKFVKAAEAVRQCASINYLSSQAQKAAVVQACKVVVHAIEQAYSGEGKAIGGFVLPDEEEGSKRG